MKTCRHWPSRDLPCAFHPARVAATRSDAAQRMRFRICVTTTSAITTTVKIATRTIATRGH